MSVEIEQSHEVRPLHDRVAVKVIKLEEKTKGGIIVNLDGKPLDTSMASVISVGPDVQIIKTGDTIALTKRCGDEIELDGQRIILIKESMVLARIRSKDD